MKYKNTFVSTTGKALSIIISVTEGVDEEVRTVEECNITLPFHLVPPELAHQIASHLVLANSYFAEDGKIGNPLPVSPRK